MAAAACQRLFGLQMSSLLRDTARTFLRAAGSLHRLFPGKRGIYEQRRLASDGRVRSYGTTCSLCECTSGLPPCYSFWTHPWGVPRLIATDSALCCIENRSDVGFSAKDAPQASPIVTVGSVVLTTKTSRVNFGRAAKSPIFMKRRWVDLAIQVYPEVWLWIGVEVLMSYWRALVADRLAFDSHFDQRLGSPCRA